MEHRPIAVEIYTATHRILGRVQPGTSGLFSFLNLPTSSSLEIEGATLTRLHQPGRMVARYQRLWLRKHEIFAILLSSPGELGPATVVRAGYSSTRKHWIHIIAGGYEMRGSVQTPGDFSFDAFMAPTEQVFTALFKGELRAILFPSIQADSPAMLFNRDKVDAIALLPREEVRELEEDEAP